VKYAPEPDKNGVRWYGPPYAKRQEDPARCAVQIFGRTGSYQCEHPRKPGTEFCGVHAPAPDDRITMFYIGVGHYGAEAVGGIKTVEVAKLTSSRVQLPNGTWDKWESRSGRYFVDKETAIERLRERHLRAVNSAAREHAEAELELREFEAIYPRKDPI